jgi:glutaredoxin-like YruB-family protein
MKQHFPAYQGEFIMFRPLSLFVFLFTALFALSCRAETPFDGPQTPIKSGTVQAQKYPRIVLYSVSWCPHCKEAKDYLTGHNIPFINKDVELDEDFKKELIEKYKTGGVPLIIFGKDEKVMKGFNPERFEKILKDLSK